MFSNLEGKSMVIGIGAQKSGTTWLFDYLDRHPEIYMHPLKEVHFFEAMYERELWPNAIRSRLKKEKSLKKEIGFIRLFADKIRVRKYELVKERNRYYDKPELYMEHFNRCVESENAFGEITPSYSTLSADTYGRIYQLHDPVKFIFLVRDPVDRIWSQVKMLSKFERPGFEKDTPITDRVSFALSRERIMLRTRYELTLNNLFARVPKSAVHIEFYENLHTDPAIEALCNFIGIKFNPGDYRKVVNPSAEVGSGLDQENARRIYAGLEQTYAYMERLFEGNLPAKWKSYNS